MQLTKRHLIPGVLLGLAMVGTTTAYAFYPGLDGADLSGFSEAQQTAIEQAFEIRKNAETEAQTILSNAGVDMDELHFAMRAAHEKNRAAMDAALKNNDYETFSSLVAGTPMEEEVTEAVFAKMVEAHRLRDAGDYEGARAIMEELGLKGPGMMHGMGDGKMGHMDDGE